MKFVPTIKTVSQKDMAYQKCLKEAVIARLYDVALEANEIDLQKLISMSQALLPANEGFLDRLTYTFTSDFKCAAKIDALIKHLGSLDKDGEEKFNALQIDYGVQDKKTIYEILKFAGIVCKWSNENYEELHKTITSFSGMWKKDEVRAAFVAMHDELKKEVPNDLKIYKVLFKGRTRQGSKLPEGKTLKELGYSKQDIMKLCKDFKIESSGNLKILKKVRNLISMLTEDRGYNTTTIHTYMYPILDFVKGSIDAYKYVDYFLYYITKKLGVK